MKAILTIDGKSFILPMDKAVQVLKLMAGALKVTSEYDREDDYKQYWEVQEKPMSVELKNIDGDVRLRDERGNELRDQAASRKRKATPRLGNGFLKLEGGR